VGKDADFDAEAGGEVDWSGDIDREGGAEGESCVDAYSEDGFEDHVADGDCYGEELEVCTVAGEDRLAGESVLDERLNLQRDTGHVLAKQGNFQCNPIVELDMEPALEIQPRIGTKNQVDSQKDTYLEVVPKTDADRGMRLENPDRVGSLERDAQLHVQLQAVELELQLAFRQGGYVNVEVGVDGEVVEAEVVRCEVETDEFVYNMVSVFLKGLDGCGGEVLDFFVNLCRDVVDCLSRVEGAVDGGLRCGQSFDIASFAVDMDATAVGVTMLDSILNDMTLCDMIEIEEDLQAKERSILPARVKGGRAVGNRPTAQGDGRKPATKCLEGVFIGLAREVASPDRHVQGGGEDREDEVGQAECPEKGRHKLGAQHGDQLGTTKGGTLENRRGTHVGRRIARLIYPFSRQTPQRFPTLSCPRAASPTICETVTHQRACTLSQPLQPLRGYQHFLPGGDKLATQLQGKLRQCQGGIKTAKERNWSSFLMPGVACMERARAGRRCRRRGRNKVQQARLRIWPPRVDITSYQISCRKL